MLEIVLAPKILGPSEIGALGLSLFSLIVNPRLLASHRFPTPGLKLYVPLRYQQTPSRCITCQDICVQQSYEEKRLLPSFD